MTNVEFTRSTKQRSVVIAKLNDVKRFVSAQDLFAELKAEGHRIGLSTVYRTLATLTQRGDIDVVLREDGEALYRSCSPAHHHHLMCRKCGSSVEVTGELVEAWSHDIAAAYGYIDVAHTLEIVGTCKNCVS